MWNWLIPAGIGLATNLLSNDKDDKPKAPEKMSYDNALGQAEDVLRPSYEQNREEVLGNIDNNLVNRGFYNQAPGDYMKANVMGDMASNYEAQKSQYAQNLRNNDYAQKYQAYQTNLQQSNQPNPFWSTVGNIAGSWASSEGGSDLITSWLTG